MPKLSLQYRVSPTYNQTQHSRVFAEIERQVNGISEGRITNHYTANTSAPGAHVPMPV